MPLFVQSQLTVPASLLSQSSLASDLGLLPCFAEMSAQQIALLLTFGIYFLERLEDLRLAIPIAQSITAKLLQFRTRGLASGYKLPSALS